MMRTGFQRVARLAHHKALLRTHLLPRLHQASAFGSSTDSLVARFCPEKTDLKDYALPNSSWCPDMLSLYQEFLEKTKSGGWIKIPSFKSNREHIQGLKLPLGLETASDKQDWRIFTRCILLEGQGYEYVIFFHPSEKKSVCLFQPGPYLEGPPGFAHGGSLAAMMDETFSKTAYLAGEGLFTLSLNIRFKNLIPVGSLAVLDIQVEKIEDQKLYMSCIAQSRDKQSMPSPLVFFFSCSWRNSHPSSNDYAFSKVNVAFDSLLDPESKYIEKQVFNFMIKVLGKENSQD